MAARDERDLSRRSVSGGGAPAQEINMPSVWRRTFFRFRLFAGVIAASVGLMPMLDRQSGVDAQASIAALAEAQASIARRLPGSAALSPDIESRHAPLGAVAGDRLRDVAGFRDVGCPTNDGNPISSLVSIEDNPTSRAWEGFSMRDRRGRHTRPWRALRRADRSRRGVVVQRPLLVFLETPATQQDMSKPWFGPVRFDRPGFPTTKHKIAEQVFGKGFDYRDPASVAGFYYRESGGELIIRGDKHSVHTVLVPHMTFDPRPMAEAILDQLDAIVDFRQHADEFGWADPIFVMTPLSAVLDVYEPALMSWQGRRYVGLGPNVEDIGPALTDDALPDGTHVGLASMAITMVAANFGGHTAPTSRWFGVDPDMIRFDNVLLYAHEYGHAIGLSHMMSLDYAHELDVLGSNSFQERALRASFNRDSGSSFISTVMNYAAGSGFVQFIPRDGRPGAGLDAVNRSKLGWGNVLDVTLAGNGRSQPGHLAPGERERIEIVEHLGRHTFDKRPQIVRVNLPPKEVALFPRTDGSGHPTTTWRPGNTGTRMVWSGRTYGGSRMMETELRIPANLPEPVLSFWTKFGGHANYGHFPGWEFGWVQISTDRGRTWTSLAGQTTTTVVNPARAAFEWFGDDLGAPALSGNSHAFSADGWVFEQVPLPVSAGTSIRLRFNFSGFHQLFNQSTAEFGWFIDDIYLGTTGDATRHLVSDFEDGDKRRWSGLLPEFDHGLGFAIVEETAAFPHSYLFELRGNNTHDDIAFKELFPKVLTVSSVDVATYRYDEGVVGYYVDHHASFSVYPYFHAGSATMRRVPAERLRRAWISYPHTPQIFGGTVYSFAQGFFAALNPASGFTFDDLLVFIGGPHEYFGVDVLFGDTLFLRGFFPNPSPVTLLDATPTYRPIDVQPSIAQTPFPNRPSRLWPFTLGAPGGWPISIGHGPLGKNDATTTTVLGQPFLARDAAFHPDRNSRFDDRLDYRSPFFSEFAAWHRRSATEAFGSMTPSERFFLRPTTAVPVGNGQVIQRHRVEYCHQNAAGACVDEAQVVKRPFVDQVIYERLATMVLGLTIGGCVQPVEESLATKPAWDAFYACMDIATQQAHAAANDLLDIARNVGNNPAYAFLNAFGDKGMLSPGLWAEAYTDFWSRAKMPPLLPAAGVVVDVERITKGDTPVATVTIKRAGQAMTRR
jgi:hypothetical protein